MATAAWPRPASTSTSSGRLQRMLSGLSQRLEQALASSSLPSDGVSEINSEVDYDEEEEEQLEDEVIDDPIPNFQIEPQANGPDPFDRLRYHPDTPPASSGESDPYGPSTSLESARRSVSEASWASSLSPDEEGPLSPGNDSEAAAAKFVRLFVTDLFNDASTLNLERKAHFGELIRHEPLARACFARAVNAQRARSRRVEESTFFSLVQHFALTLFECLEAEDFAPAKALMNLSFTFYYEALPSTSLGCSSTSSTPPERQYLHAFLRDQRIWRSQRFWHAAFFDALQTERARGNSTRDGVSCLAMDSVDEQRFAENVAFGQLGTFTCNMHAFGLTKIQTAEFLRKQCTVANLRPEQEAMLKANLDRMYGEPAPPEPRWRRFAQELAAVAASSRRS